MRVVLTEDVVGLGDIGQDVAVRRGYARNFLIPRKLALEVGTAHGKELTHKMKQVEAKKRRYKGAADESAKKLKGVTLKLTLRVGTGGKVFGSVTSRDIAEKLHEQGYDLDRRRVLLSEPLKKIGSHYVEVKLHPEVKVQVRVDIEAVQASKDEEEKETELARKAMTDAKQHREKAEAAPEEKGKGKAE